GLFIDADLCGIVSLYKRDCTNPVCDEVLLKEAGQSFQFRAMAIVASKQGQGLGSLLLNDAERHAAINKARYMWANARTSAKGFYRRAGYNVGQHEFVIEGVGPHVIVS